MKFNWKKIGTIAFDLGKQLFPVLSLVESLAKIKGLSSKEKQNLAFNILHDDLVSGLLPSAASDPRLEAAIRKLIDDGVALNNLVAELKDASSNDVGE